MLSLSHREESTGELRERQMLDVVTVPLHSGVPGASSKSLGSRRSNGINQGSGGHTSMFTFDGGLSRSW